MTSRMLPSKLVRNQTNSGGVFWSTSFQWRHPTTTRDSLTRTGSSSTTPSKGSRVSPREGSHQPKKPCPSLRNRGIFDWSLLIFFELFLSIIGQVCTGLEMRIIYLFSPVIIFSHRELSFKIICSNNISVHLHYVKIYISVRFTLKLYNSQHFLLLWFMLKPNRSALLCFAIKLSRLYRNERDFILVQNRQHTSIE